MTPEIRKRLMKNWDEPYGTMKAEARYYDPLSGWECYIYAIDPKNPDTFEALISGETIENAEFTFTELFAMYNENGLGVWFDQEYRPKNIDEIYKKLIQEKGNASR